MIPHFWGVEWGSVKHYLVVRGILVMGLGLQNAHPSSGWGGGAEGMGGG